MCLLRVIRHCVLKLTMKSVVRARNAVLVIGMETLTVTYALAPICCMAFAIEDNDTMTVGVTRLEIPAVLKNMSVPTYLQQVW